MRIFFKSVLIWWGSQIFSNDIQYLYCKLSSMSIGRNSIWTLKPLTYRSTCLTNLQAYMSIWCITVTQHFFFFHTTWKIELHSISVFTVTLFVRRCNFSIYFYINKIFLVFKSKGKKSESVVFIGLLIKPFTFYYVLPLGKERNWRKD